MAAPLKEAVWVAVGLIGQLLFTGRFVLQWIASEKAKKSIVTPSFWTFSILGSSVLSVYAIYRKDPVFILGQVPGIFIYARNLVIMKKQEQADKQTAAPRPMQSPASEDVGM